LFQETMVCKPAFHANSANSRVLHGLKFLSALAPHPQNLNPPRTRGSLRNLARSHPAPVHF